MNGNLGRKLQIFPIHVYLTPPLRDFPWNFVTTVALEEKLVSCTRRWEKFDDMCISLDTEVYGQTDRRTSLPSRLQAQPADARSKINEKDL